MPEDEGQVGLSLLSMWTHSLVDIGREALAKQIGQLIPEQYYTRQYDAIGLTA
ncbi:hypothetical protein Clacol_007878 [Clathrus columnatus]|uniref:Uncharacterized protein n=1 Tax=Clathrus columnatus TaxID=1419009 RepID=A0AAV5AG47_9AGAM|nr:hypothetical protein Clacol_007878 [Clathrus columnatus]